MACDFCRILIDNDNTLYAEDTFVALLDIDPISRGHVIVLPRAHYRDIDELPAATLHAMMRFVQLYVRLLKDRWNPKGYSIMQNGGDFNDLGHFHLHVFPRFTESEFRWVYDDQFQPDQDYISAIRAALQPTIEREMLE